MSATTSHCRGTSLALLRERGLDAALVVGSPVFSAEDAAALSSVSTVAIGPRASQAPFTTSVAIDTGVAGIHESGVAYRMDEVPLELRAPVNVPRTTAEVLAALSEALGSVPVESG